MSFFLAVYILYSFVLLSVNLSHMCMCVQPISKPNCVKYCFDNKADTL